MNSRNKGNLAEDRACEYLQKLGYKIVERNFYCKGGEIDIIAYKDEVFHFIEVKSGKTFEPIFNITTSKLKKVIKCSYFYMKKNMIKSAFCIDAIIVKDDIEFIKNITL